MEKKCLQSLLNYESGHVQNPNFIGYVWFSKILRENERKRKEKLKIDLMLVNYFYTFLQIHLTYFLSLYKD